jgi:hypothetical protein
MTGSRIGVGRRPLEASGRVTSRRQGHKVNEVIEVTSNQHG